MPVKMVDWVAAEIGRFKPRAQALPWNAMCNLYSNTTTQQAMRDIFDVVEGADKLGNFAPLPAIYPKHMAPIVAIGSEGTRSLVNSHWGFLTPNKSKKTGAWLKPQAWNNARSEKIETNGLWKASFENRRCLIPATGFAEATGRNPATYHWFRMPDVEAFAFAGIWKYQKETVGETEVDTVVHSMVMTEANGFMSDYHNRMPVLLSPASYETWLTGATEDAAAHMRPAINEALEMFGEGAGLRSEP
ncbi:MAG: SOS response-associated peptidase [Pseudomonadota bacterium]